jgi:hypothetical protein
MRFDAEADAAFFDLDPADELVRRARRAILRDRKGADGHAVIPPRVKQMLLVLAAGPDDALVDELAAADDPDLVLALMPRAYWLSWRQAASVIATLDAHGRRREARRHRDLWVGRGGHFTVLGHRRFSASRLDPLRKSGFSPAKERLEALSEDEYYGFVNHRSGGEGLLPWMRTPAWSALRTGTMSFDDVLGHTHPAALAVSLAVCDVDHPLAGEPRAADDMRISLAKYLGEQLGADPERWAYVVANVNGYQGTIPELAAESATPSDHRAAVYPNPLAKTDVDPANILLALMPRNVAARALRTTRMEPHIATAAAKAPLCRALVEHVIADGTGYEQTVLAANAATPDPVLLRLLEMTASTDAVFAIMDRRRVGRKVLERAYATAPRGDRLKQWLTGRNLVAVAHALRYMTDDPAWLLSVLRATIPQPGPHAENGRVLAYKLLADVAGVEAVWALELELAGSLDAMAPYVRASMARGDALPLAQASWAIPDEEARWAKRHQSWSSDEALDHPLDRPLEKLIRLHLDRHPERWLRLAALLQADVFGSDEKLIAEASRLP